MMRLPRRNLNSFMKTESPAAAALKLSIHQTLPALPPLSRQSLWLPHGSACPSHAEQKPPPTDRHDILLGLLAIIFVLVLIVVFIAAIVILADRIRTLWRETRGAGGGCGIDVERGLFVSSWGRRVRRKRRTRTTT